MGLFGDVVKSIVVMKTYKAVQNHEIKQEEKKAIKQAKKQARAEDLALQKDVIKRLGGK